MSKLSKFAGLATLVAVVGAVVVGALAFAWPVSAAPLAPAQRLSAPLAHGGGRGFGGGLCGEAGLAAAAEALNMTADELSTELWGGTTLSALAEEAGVELQAVRDAVQEACDAATREAIEQAVTDGDLTREHADWLLEGLEKGFWGGRGFGPGGHGFRGPGRMGGFRFGSPTPAPTTGTSG